MKKLLGVALVLCLVVGCIQQQDETGEPTVVIDPEVVATIDGVAEFGDVAVAVAGPLSIYWPPAAGIAGIIAGVVGAWRKMKPKLTKAETEASKAYVVTEAIVYAIEEFKKTNRDDWEKLKSQLTKTIGPETENVIRALRGLTERV